MKLWNKILLLFICILLVNGNVEKAQAATFLSESEDLYNPIVIVQDQFVIKISYGFYQEARYARYADFSVDIYNKGDTIQGTVKATLLNHEQDNITYAKTASLLGGSKTQVCLQLPMNQTTQEINFTLTDSYDKTIVEELIPLNIKNYGANCVVGILSDKPIGLAYFQYFGGKIINLDKNNLPCDYLGYDMLDAIVVDHFNLDSLETKEFECLLNFVERGGNLILGVNEEDQSNIELLEQYHIIKTEKQVSYDAKDHISIDFTACSDSDFVKMLTGIRDYESSRNIILQEIADSKLKIPTAGENTYIGNPMLGSSSITSLKNQSKLEKVTKFTLVGVEKVIEKEGVRLYEQVHYGNGTVMIYHFCLQNEEITPEKLALYQGCSDELLSAFYAGIVYQVRMNLSDVTISRLNEEPNGGNLDYRIQELDDYSEIKRIPKVENYIVVLMLYIFLIGPVSFFTLWKLKKQSKVWIVVPGITIIFFAIVSMLGSSTRIDQPYAGFLNIEYYDHSLSNVQGITYATIGLNEKSPKSIFLNNADVVVAGESAYPSFYNGIYTKETSERKFYDYTDASMNVKYQDDGIEINFYNKAAFDTELFYGLYHKDYEPIVASNLFLTDETLTGTIVNHSKQTLHDTLLYLCGYYAYIGTLMPGEVADLSDCITLYIGGMGSLLYTNNDIKKSFGLVEEQLSSSQSRKVNAYSYAFDKYMLGSEDPFIIGSLEEISKESPFYDISKEDGSYGDSIVVEKLDVNFSNTNEYIVPSIDRYLEDSSIYIWDESTRLSYINAIELAYQIPQSEQINELYISNLFNDFSNKEYSTNKCSRIYLYNYSTERYELVFDLESEYGTRSITRKELIKFINSDNQLNIRYENKDMNEEMFEVPIISCRKETISADN